MCQKVNVHKQTDRYTNEESIATNWWKIFEHYHWQQLGIINSRNGPLSLFHCNGWNPFI